MSAKDLHVVSLQVENFKRLKAVRIDPASGLVMIAGRNAQGKSSVMDAIGAVLMGGNACPKDPIRHGEESATIRLDLGEVVVTRRFTPAGSTLTITGANGAKVTSPQALLNSLLGSLTFDPLAFIRMKPRDQFDQLKSVVNVAIDLEALAAQNEKDREKRTDLNREAKTLWAQAAGLPADASEPVDVSEVLEEIKAVEERNAEIRREQENLRNLRDRAVFLTRSIEEQDAFEADLRRRFEAQLAKVQEDRKKLTDEKAQVDQKLESQDEPLPPEDTAPLLQKVKDSQAINERAAAAQRREELVAKAEEIEAKAEELSENIKARDEEKVAALAAVTMPVEGLSLGDSQVLFNGVPLEQASSAEQLRVSTALAMAANPKVKVVLIREGSLLDENGLLLVAEMAEERGYQVWIEKVDSSKSMGIVIEDGEVFADHSEGVA